MQTSYNVNPSPGVVGTLAESGGKVVRGKIADGVVRPGQYVVISGNLCSHPSAEPTPENRGGIAMRKSYAQDDSVFADGDVVDICVDGVVWAAAESAVTADTKAFVRVTAAGAEEKGALRLDSDSGDAFMIPGLFFRTAGTALVKLEVNKSAEVT
jgi:hypothetical protein